MGMQDIMREHFDGPQLEFLHDALAPVGDLKEPMLEFDPKDESTYGTSWMYIASLWSMDGTLPTVIKNNVIFVGDASHKFPPHTGGNLTLVLKILDQFGRELSKYVSAWDPMTPFDLEGNIDQSGILELINNVWAEKDAYDTMLKSKNAKLELVAKNAKLEVAKREVAKNTCPSPALSLVVDEFTMSSELCFFDSNTVLPELNDQTAVEQDGERDETNPCEGLKDIGFLDAPCPTSKRASFRARLPLQDEADSETPSVCNPNPNRTPHCSERWNTPWPADLCADPECDLPVNDPEWRLKWALRDGDGLGDFFNGSSGKVMKGINGSGNDGDLDQDSNSKTSRLDSFGSVDRCSTDVQFSDQDIQAALATMQTCLITRINSTCSEECKKHNGYSGGPLGGLTQRSVSV